MNQPKFTRHETISLKNHPDFDENWVKERIKEDPSMLGLGDVVVMDIERRQPKGGRLDILLRATDPEEKRRYEVEVMLGAVDESHIIRTIEYWDIERKRYTQYDHYAVIVAEDITTRFLNVIGLFNSAIPLIAIKMSALRVDDHVVLQFTKVLDAMDRGEDDEEEERAGGAADRGYWEEKGSKESVAVADECVTILKEIDPSLFLKFNRYYIGLESRGGVTNFVTFGPKKKFLRVTVRIGDKEVWLKRLDEAGLDTFPGGQGRIRTEFSLTTREVEQHRDLLKELFAASHKEFQD